MLNPISTLPIVFGQSFLPQTLPRTPESSEVMSEETSVRQYDLAMESKLAIVYAGALMLIHQAARRQGGKAIDLCCGPGHFTLLLAKHFDFEEIIGIDLSESMIQAANQNAKDWGLQDRVRFEVADAIDPPVADSSFSVVTCNDAAHHLPDLEHVERLLSTMGRLCAADGTVLLTDLVRLKNQSVTDRYTYLIGQDYLDRGLDAFQADFCASMQAAWTGEELRSAVPGDSESRRWSHREQRLLPTVQAIIGYPNDERPMRLRSTMPWTPETHPVPQSMRMDWQMFRRLL
ncbi:MAG: class I SAM-dependent methyltransferase [Planctomycetota bacterium]